MRLATAFASVVLLIACEKAERPGIYQAPGSDAGLGFARDVRVATDTGPACTGEGIRCDGQTPYRCGPNGQRAELDPCGGERPFCVAGVGCLRCPPSATRCDPDHPAVPQRCADDGSRWLDQAACDASGGQRCVSGRCGDPCDVPDGAQQYLGCDYWATVTPNSQLYRGFPFAVALANPQDYAVTVRISGGALDAPREVTLAPGAAEAVELPWVPSLAQFSSTIQPCACERPAMCSNPVPARSALARGGAYQIRATAPVAAYQFNPLTFEARTDAGMCVNSYTNDASLLLAQRALTRRYLVLTAPQFNRFGGFIAVVATTGESTSVTVRLPARHGVPEASADGVVRHDNLTPGDVAVIVGAGSGDLSGAVVEASAPVAVFAGHDCTFVPHDRPACDHLEEQVLPIETLGRDFVVSDLRDRDAPTLVRMVASLDDTTVRFDPPSLSPARVLAAGQVLDVPATQSFRVISSRPLMVAQIMTGLGVEGIGAGDPAMVQEVPAQQFRDRYDFFVPGTYTTNFLGVVTPRGSTPLLDEAPLVGEVERLGPWDIVHARVAPGRHRLRTAEGVPLGVKVYGTARYTSYMYPGGLDLRLLTPG